jgi:hypothetical protein
MEARQQAVTAVVLSGGTPAALSRNACSDEEVPVRGMSGGVGQLPPAGGRADEAHDHPEEDQ